MFKKKAEVVVSFSWLFMAIVGVFFIALSYNIITKYQDIEEEKFRLELQQTLRTILNNVGRTAGVEENLVEPLGDLFRDSDVELSCFSGIPIMSINGYPFAENSFIRNYPTGLTSISQGKIANTYLAVESFRIPFKTSNILTFVSDYNLIVFDKDSEITEDFLKKFQQESAYRNFKVNYDYSFSDLSRFREDVRRSGLTSVMFVSDSGVSINGLNLDDLNFQATHVQIDYSDTLNGAYSTIKYVGSNMNDFEQKDYKSVDYDNSLTLETLAIFSNPSAFDCAYNQVIENTKVNYDFYLKKIDEIIEIAQDTRICSSSQILEDSSGEFSGALQVSRYQRVKDDLLEIRNLIENDGFNSSSDLIDYLGKLSESFKALEQVNCYVIY